MTSDLTTIDPNELDLWSDFAAEGSMRHLPKGSAMLKFNGQTGKFVTPKMGEEDLTGARLLADPRNAFCGWTKFENKKPVASHIVQLPNRMLPRSELPDRDPALWVEKGLDGKPADPWSAAFYLPMVNEQEGTAYIYITSSVSGIRAIKDLIGAYGHSLTATKNRNRLPIIELDKERFKSKFGSWVFAPILDVVGWREAGAGTEQIADTAAPTAKALPRPAASKGKKAGNRVTLKNAAAADADFNDDIPL